MPHHARLGAGHRICSMETSFNKFVALIKPFQTLWKSARVTCLGVGAPLERRSVATRVLLRQEELPKGQPFRQMMWSTPTPEFLIAVLDFPKDTAVRVLASAINMYYVDLETGSTVDRVLLQWPLPQDLADVAREERLSTFSWQDPFQCDKSLAINQFGEDSTCLVLTGTGGYIRDVMSDQLCRAVSSSLRRERPHFDGIEELYERLLPGVRHGISDLRVVQIVFPLPLDMEQTEDGRLGLRAPKLAAEGQMRIVVNFKPVGRATAIEVAHHGAETTVGEEATERRWQIPWPQGAESAKASLFYAREEVSSIDLRRWASARGLRAAVDCYFDPDHKLLQGALFGEGEKEGKHGTAQRTFEIAVVRLMSLLGIPLVWYGQGASPRRSDAAGLVDKKERRVVVLAECTLEKPEAKFSALKERGQRLGEWLAGEAEVLPVVFTQANPPEAVFEAACDHGVALVGQSQLNSLFHMLSGTASEDVLDFLNRLRSHIPR